MSTNLSHSTAPAPEPARPARGLRVAVAMTAVIVAFFVLREHWGHVAGYWPYLLLLACPVMHLFHGHGGHGGHGSHAHHDAGNADATPPRA